MKSEEIQKLLTSLRETNITDGDASSTLQRIRTHAMATKGSVQRLVNLACVPCVLKLLYRHISMDKTETDTEKAASEESVSVALSIVANLLTEKGARQQVKRDGMETLVTLLTDFSSEEIKIRCCRSLSNLAMDLPSRPVLAQASIVPAMVKVLEIQYIEVEKQQNTVVDPKSQNTDAASEEPKKESSSESEEFDIEAKFPSVALVEAACRVLRYIFGDCKVRQQLVEAGIVRPLAMLVKSEDFKLVSFVLRTLSELWTKMNKRITEKMAAEVSRAGVVPKLLELIDHDDDKTSAQAFTIVLPLARHPQPAAVIGAADGVDFFLSHLNSSRKHILHHELISALCQLAREAVNRVKLRTAGGLKVFLDTLQDDRMEDVQDLVVSCLVSFLYDDTSLDDLLDNGLVDILLAHLQRCGNYTSDLSLNLFESAETLLEAAASVSNRTEEAADMSHVKEEMSTSKGSNDNNETRNKLLVTGDKSTVDHPEFVEAHHFSSATSPETRTERVSQVQTENRNASNRSLSTFGVNDDVNCSEEQTSSTRNKIAEDIKEEEEATEDRNSQEMTGTQRYSMNSPSYHAETTWRMEDYHPGVTCKSYNIAMSPDSSTTNCSDDSRSSAHHPYSPLSAYSYVSPSRSCQFSPSRSSLASSPTYSYAGLSPVHSLFDSSYEHGSPFSPEGNSCEGLHMASSPLKVSSPEWDRESCAEQSNTKTIHGQQLLFSSSEDEDCTEDSEHAADVVDANNADAECSGGQLHKREHLSGQKHGLGTCDSHPPAIGRGKSVQFSNTVQHYDGSLDKSEHFQQSPAQRFQNAIRLFRVTDTALDNNEDDKSAEKRQKAQRGSGIHACTTQNNILILLSRLSVRDDLSQRLATTKVMLCLTDHLALAEEPHDRCVRILSRMMTSPHCFSSLLKMCAPAIIVRTLMLDSQAKLIPQDSLQEQKRNPAEGLRFTRHLSIEEMNMRSLMMMNRDDPQNLPIEASLARSQSTTSYAESTHGHTALQPDQRTLRKASTDSVKSENTQETQGSQAHSSGKKSIQELTRIGSKLLEDLSQQAMSPYSDGVIQYTLNCRSSAHKLLFSASLLFLQTHWSPERRQKLLIQKGAVDKVLSALCAPNNADLAIKDVFVLSLIFLSRSLRIKPKFKAADVQPLLTQAVKVIAGKTHPPSHSNQSENAELTSQQGAGHVCSYARAEKDLKIEVGKEQSCQILHASREMLVKNSPVFAAMLEGNYVESTQSQISISDTCCEAMTSVLHYLHSCDQQCPALKSLNTLTEVTGAQQTAGDSHQDIAQDSVTPHTGQSGKAKRLKHLMDMIALADRFLLPELVQYLCAVVSTSLLDASCAEQVFCFAAFHGQSHLAEDCMHHLLLSSGSVRDTANCLITLAEGEFSSEVAVAIQALVKRGLMTP